MKRTNNCDRERYSRCLPEWTRTGAQAPTLYSSVDSVLIFISHSVRRNFIRRKKLEHSVSFLIHIQRNHIAKLLVLSRTIQFRIPQEELSDYAKLFLWVPYERRRVLSETPTELKVDEKREQEEEEEDEEQEKLSKNIAKGKSSTKVQS